jgi:pilus assembly protein CpaB
MNRTTRTMIVVAVAVLVAAIASLGAYTAIKRMPVREVEVHSISQVIATRDMPIGTMVTKDDVKVVPWPASSPVPRGFTSIDKAINRGLISAVLANEPLTESKLASIEAGAGLAPTITEGMRAMAVRVNDVVGVAGFVVPGAHVDVIVTIKPEGEKDSLSRVVLSDVQVLSAGTRIDQEKAKEGQAMPGTSVVTLLLTPEDSEKLVLAQHEGSITLILRNPLDRQPTETQGTRTAALLGKPAPPPVVVQNPAGRRAPKVAPPPIPAPTPAPPPIYKVEAFRGGKRSEEVVQ